MAFLWNETSIDKLKKLWSEGFSAREIAQQISGDTLTRNAVIGKAHRMGLKARTKTPEAPPVITFIPKERECKWPSGHPGESGFKFCLAPTVEGKSYCKAHCRKAYRNSSD